MFIVELIYLAVLVVSAVFFILYRDLLALILFIVVVAIPVLLFLSVVIMRLSVRMTVKSDSTVITKGSKGHIYVNVKNYFILPITCIRLYGSYSNHFFNRPDKGELSFWASPFTNKTFDMEVESDHVGNITVKCNNARVYDYFGVFSLPVRINKEFSFSVIPPLDITNIALRQNMYTLSESNVFSKHKPGDDPSEVFQIRDYVGGDKLNRIHWKLSTKQQHFMVKDYSLPVNESVLILLDFCCNIKESHDLDLIDTVIETAFSLSNMFIERNTVHTIGWYNTKSNSIYTCKIEGLDDLYTCIGLMYNSTSYYDKPYVAQLDMEHQQNMSHVLYIAPNISDEHCSLITNTKSPNCIFTLLNVVDEDKAEKDMSNDSFNVVTVKAGKVGSSLYDITL